MDTEEKIMVVPSKQFAFRYADDSLADILPDIEDTAQYLRRGDVENDYNYLQIIPYCIIVDNEQETIFVTHRVSGGDNRLLNQYSIGAGGHIREPEKILDGIERELREEVGLESGEYDIDIFGAIQSAITDVDRVHLAITCFIEPEQSSISKIRCLEDELEGQWMTLDEIDDIYNQLESWSQIVFATIRDRIF
jgi:predicted NUDIX family phosphoesterase